TPLAATGNRISEMRLKGRPIEADKTYRVGGWASINEGAQGAPIWDVVETWLRDQKTIKPRALNEPALVGVKGNAGLAS
ncbi:MAG TPA: thiosulfohydrolase SoxB, partial [Burkholderiaceae bacterium]